MLKIVEFTCVNCLLVGCFNLDPNRVLDITLESFETRPNQHRLFIDLLRSYMPNANVICEILGYKYRYFADSETPQSLYVITALLLQCGLIRLDDIYIWVCEISIGIFAQSHLLQLFHSLVVFFWMNIAVGSNRSKLTNWLGARNR